MAKMSFLFLIIRFWLKENLSAIWGILSFNNIILLFSAKFTLRLFIQLSGSNLLHSIFSKSAKILS